MTVPRANLDRRQSGGPELSGKTGRSVHLRIGDEWDGAVARRHARTLAREAGLSEASGHALATAISEIVHNVIVHANRGEATMEVVEERGRRGVVVIVRDEGPGIRELARAMQDGHSTVNSLGLGLPSARRLVDDFELATVTGRGTTVILKKW
jgi:serine/threonine-protein kinase RsbT